MGNRLIRSTGGNTDTYAYSPTSNRIASITPQSGPVRSFSFDPNGSTTADGVNAYAYDVRGRMVQATSSLGVTTYQVNALGQRVRKTNSPGDTVFHYDTAGHLIAETNPAGAVLREYVWLGDIPIAVIAPSGSGYIHVDHLNTPRLVANAAGTTVWRWDQSEPFGVNVPDENPSGLGTFDLPLRLPGQYFDKETNLHYNYFRDYDPGLGRYHQSDPIGLRGGLNTYGYTGQAPILWSDPRGENFALGGMLVGGTVVFLAIIANQSSNSNDKGDKGGGDGMSGGNSDRSGAGSPDPCKLFPPLCPPRDDNQVSCPGSDKQFGHKYGQHRDPTRPGYRTPKEYRDLADRTYSDPNAKRTQFPRDGGRYSGETHIQSGSDLLRLDPSGNFRSLYPID